MPQTTDTKQIKQQIRAAKRSLQKAERLILDAEKGEISVHIATLLAAGQAMRAGMDTRDAERNARSLHDATKADYQQEVVA